MLKKYPLGVSIFLILAFLATLFSPYEWGNEKLRTERERQSRVYITATLEGEETPYGTTSEQIFPIEKRGFILGSSWSEIQIGWGWEITLETQRGDSIWRRSDSVRSAIYYSLYDSLIERRNRRFIFYWMDEKLSESYMALPLPKNRRVDDYFYRDAAFPYAMEGLKPPQSKDFFDKVARHRKEFFQYKPRGILWLNNFRQKYPQYADLTDSLLCDYITNSCPPELYKERFLRDMDNDSLRVKLLVLYSQLGLLSQKSLNGLNIPPAPPPSRRFKTPAK